MQAIDKLFENLKDKPLDTKINVPYLRNNYFKQ
jgi:hypothetical protein